MTSLKCKGRSAGRRFPSIGFIRLTPLQSRQRTRPSEMRNDLDVQVFCAL